jgi:hypothetical protein
MRLLRSGAVGSKKPGVLYAQRHIQDLSSMIADITGDAPGKLRGLGNDQAPPLVSRRRNTSSLVIDNTTPTGPPDAGLPSAAAANCCRLCLVSL